MQAIATLCFAIGFTIASQAFELQVVDESEDSSRAALATYLLALNTGARWRRGSVGHSRTHSLRTPRYALPLMQDHDTKKINSKRRLFLKSLAGVGAASFVGKAAATTEGTSMYESDDEVTSGGFAGPSGLYNADDATYARPGDIDTDGMTIEADGKAQTNHVDSNVDVLAATTTTEYDEARPVANQEGAGGSWKGVAAGAFATLAAGHITLKQMQPKTLQEDINSLRTKLDQNFRDLKDVELLVDMKRYVAEALATGKVTLKQMQSMSLNGEMDSFKAQLDQSSHDSDDDNDDDALLGAMKRYVEEARALRAERNSIAVAHKETEARLAAEQEAKASLQSKVAQKEGAVSSLEALLKNAESKAAGEAKNRVAAEAAAAEAEIALMADLEQSLDELKGTQEMVGDMQDQVATLHSELAISETALEAQEARAADEATAMQRELDKHVEEARALRIERNSIAVTLKETEAKLAAELETKASLESTTAAQATFALQQGRDATMALQTGMVVVDELRKKVASLVSKLAASEAALEEQEAKSVAEAAAMKNGVDKHTVEASTMRAERDSIAAALKEAEGKLAMEQKAKASLEAQVLQNEREISLLQASLKDAETKAANDRIAAEAATADATRALEAGKIRLDGLQEKVTSLLAELAASEAVANAQAAKASTEKAAMKKDLDQQAEVVQATRAERDSLAAALKEAEATLETEVNGNTHLVGDLREEVASLHSKLAWSETALKAQEAKVATDAVLLQEESEKHAEEARAMLTERNSIAAALEEADAKLAAELKEKASLEEKLKEKTHLVSSLRASLKDAKSQVADERMAADEQAAKAMEEGMRMKKDIEKYEEKARSLLSERDSISIALKEAEAKLEAELKAKASLESKVEQKEQNVNSLEASLRDVASKSAKDMQAVEAATAEATIALQTGKLRLEESQERVKTLLAELVASEAAMAAQEAKASAEATAMKTEVKIYAQEASRLQSERNSIAVALDEAEGKLAAELKMRAVLESQLSQKEGNVISLEASLKDAGLKTANERIAAEAATAEATLALEAGKKRSDELHEKVASLLAELATSEAASKAQEARASAEATAMKTKIEKQAKHALTMQAERSSITAALKEAEEKLEMERKAKASLKAQVLQNEKDISLLQSSLKDAESQAANDRLASEAVTSEATIALQAGKMQLTELQKKVASLRSSLVASEAALEAQEANAAAEAEAMKKELEKFQAVERLLQEERSAHKDTEVKLIAELQAKAFLEARVAKMERDVNSLEKIRKTISSEDMDTDTRKVQLDQSSRDLKDSEVIIDLLQGQVANLDSEVDSLKDSLARADSRAKKDLEKRIRADWIRSVKQGSS